MLQLSEERFKALITVLEEGDKAFVGDIQRDAVAQAQADIFFQLGLRDKDLMKWGFNQIGVMKGQYHTAMLDIVSKFQAGTYSYDKAFGLWKDVSKRTVEGMYRAGAATVGNPFYKELKIPGRDLRLMSKYMRREGKFFKGLLSDIKDPKHVSIIPTDAAGKRLPGYRLQKFNYLTRAGMYPESLEAMRYNGMLMGAGRNIEIRWVLGVPMTEHCIDCPALAMRVWLPETLPTVPRAGDTKCLWKCYCHLEPRQRFMRTTFDIAGRATEGAIRAFGRNARVYDTAGQEMGGQLQREIEFWQAQEYKARQMMSTVPKSERMFWIGERKRFNRLIIDRAKAGSYRVVPTVSVSALTKTIQAAARKGGTLTAIEKLMVGDEVWLVRSDYSSFGKIGIRNGVKVFKSPTGVVLNLGVETDILFLAKGKAPVLKDFLATVTQEERRLLKRWSGDDYGSFRHYLRMNKAQRLTYRKSHPVKRMIAEDAEKIESLFNKYKDGFREGTLHRGLAGVEARYYNALKRLRPGQVIDVDTSVTSWSQLESSLHNFGQTGIAGSKNVHFKLKAGRRATRELDIDKLSKVPGEMEVLVRDTKFRVVSVTEKVGWRPSGAQYAWAPKEDILEIWLEEILR